MIPDFSFAPMPFTVFGNGHINDLPKFVKKYYGSILILTGKDSFTKTGIKEKLESVLINLDNQIFFISISGEPSPDVIDEIVQEFRSKNIECVISIGGGSVIDTGKSVSAMMNKKNSVKEYLEGVGTKIHAGDKLPFIAIPTTAGTGSEATKNAPVGLIGDKGFKKSLRHDNFIPDVAIIDPELTITCPKEVTAACGMDAFIQLLESYVSTKSNPMTDALALKGIEYIYNSFDAVMENGLNGVARSEMAFAAYLSGITLANAGLGLIHGFAASIGARYKIPHGVICGTLGGVVTKVTIKKLQKNHTNSTSLTKYADIGNILTEVKSRSDKYYCDALIKQMEKWIDDFNIPLLSRYNMTMDDTTKIIIGDTGMKNNPVKFDEYELEDILLERI